ncbi:MAG: hypothetical protein ABI589_08340 [Burkholderiales bacterium]
MHTAIVKTLATLAVTALLGACATQNRDTSSTAAPAATSPSATAPAGNAPQTAKSRDGKFSGEITGSAGPNARFAKLEIGMTSREVQEVMDRAPDRTHSYESGKRWIPFYFGNDARRMQAFYKGEGCLIFTGGNVWGGGGEELIGITYDTAGACYQP